ncbi:CD3e molecule, epsilon associated protein [Cyprinodon tularosa]|uniref:CD3e molecule, epsilon associated protein n=1 Tax=Cyprinodon tularosa TaxID=77115 RepID=UPI0018E2116F|nr:CD3e molecule, epsilon associated protein [Cyprinodon tularosa]
MPKDISSSSSSSSEDEEDTGAMETTAPQGETEKKNRRFECPEEFVSFCHVPCRSTLADNLRNNQNELWLIKAPASFDPQRFSGVKVPLTGLQTLKVPSASTGGSSQQIYSVLASTRCPADLHLLTSDNQTSDGFVFAPAFSGLLSICESYGESSTNQVPHVIPAAPPPSIPPGLKQRFHPFGSKTPTLTYVAEDEADGAAFGPSSTTLRPLVMKQFIEEGGSVDDDDNEEEGRKKKKKKKNKEKRIKSEQVELLLKVKREPFDEIPDERMTEVPFQDDVQQAEKTTTKKKKKKKKEEDREREEMEEGLEPSVRVKVEPVSVKCEPLDILYGDTAESSGKKKKKSKKRKLEED